MKRENKGKSKASSIEFQCGYCAKNILTSGDKKDEHPVGWKCITKESDAGIENFYLCPDCMTRYRSSQAEYRNS